MAISRSPDVCVYWWKGGRERGTWNHAPAYGYDVKDILDELRRKGYVAVKGNRNIGPPDDPPPDYKFRELVL